MTRYIKVSWSKRSVNLQIADRRLQTKYKMQNRYKLQTWNKMQTVKKHIHTYTLYLTTLAPTTTKVDFHGGRRYKKYYKEYKKEGN